LAGNTANGGDGTGPAPDGSCCDGRGPCAAAAPPGVRTPAGERPTVLVVGNGMVGHHVVERAVESGLTDTHRLVVVGEERRRAYDRVHLSSLFDGASPEDLALGDDLYAHDTVELVLGDPVVALDPAARTATTASGRVVGYHAAVLATGSAPFVPPVAGTDAAGVFVYRTIDDVEAIRRYARGRRRGVVVGGGLLGVEAANALRLLGLETTVVELAPRLMALQLDDGGSALLRREVEALGLEVRTGVAASAVRTAGGAVASLVCGPLGAPADGGTADDGEELACDLVVFAAGVRPRDALARDAGLSIGERGGVVVDDRCQTSAAGLFAVGEVAVHRGRVYGLVGPGLEMADVVVANLVDPGNGARFDGADLSTRLKLLGVDVASVGRADATGHEVVVSDPTASLYQRVVLDDDSRVLGAVLVGDLEPYPTLLSHLRSGAPLPRALDVLRPTAGAGALGGRAGAAAPDEALLCSCRNVSHGAVRAAARDGAGDVKALKSCTKAGTGCGSCVAVLQEVLDDEARKAGRSVRRGLCPHFACTRPELFELVRVTGIRTFSELVARHGQGRGCEICKPAVASMFASLASGHILDGEQATLQDTNDHFLANIQRDGTYSVVPRVPGGEITPAQLIAIGEVARDFDLYTKITGGQRIDLFGARVEELPAIWARLIAAGLESGHAYGKAVRTVKSCVGTTWCRYGVQDSTRMAIDLELRYRGLRAPHKIKLAVSGCARECAEAQSKDVGVIATERGWNLYVGGNGGMRPAHAELLAEGLDDGALVQAIDRYLMWYVRTAERLERTATWQRELPGGIDFVRAVVLDDALGIGAELEADMARHVERYRCEWQETLEDPRRLQRFVTFVNSDTPEPSIAHVRVRGQRVPDAVRAGAQP
jgi:nitrite reductase (NADH) large subunit